MKTESNFDEELNASRGISDKARMEAEKGCRWSGHLLSSQIEGLELPDLAMLLRELKRRRGE